MADEKEDVYCTLLMSDSYLPGAAVLAHSLRDSGTTKKLAVLITADSLLYNTITQLKSLYDYVLPVDKLANPNVENLTRLDRLDLRFAFTKIALWKQEQFRKIVYIDADVVALRAPDELFQLDAPFAAAPDIGWPDCFNTGVMVLSPNMGDYQSLHTLASSGTSFDGADQGLLNEYYGGRPWHWLSFAYNCTPSASYQYEPAYRHFRSSISMTHFIGKDKPWTRGREALSSSGSGVYKELLGKWWSVYDRHYKIPGTSGQGQASPGDRHISPFVKGEQDGDILDASDTAKGPQNRDFSAPPMPWDATRAGPPSQSKPEAGSFPRQKYEMSHDSHLFHAPQAYPAPPGDMYYQVPPKAEAERPKPIFPWEHTARKPTRVFADSGPQSPAATPAPSGPQSSDAGSIMGTSSGQQPMPGTPPGMGSEDVSSFPRTNAWDNDSSIDAYVRAVQSQTKVGKVQVLHDTTALSDAPPASPKDSNNPDSRPHRRESLILTDFPTELERPSLPVTPAPFRRPSFWGEERNDAGNLPSALGVPDQADWNPHEQLEQLRKNSILAAQELPEMGTDAEGLGASGELPKRDMPGTSAPLPMPVVAEAKEKEDVPSSVNGGPAGGRGPSAAAAHLMGDLEREKAGAVSPGTAAISTNNTSV